MCALLLDFFKENVRKTKDKKGLTVKGLLGFRVASSCRKDHSRSYLLAIR